MGSSPIGSSVARDTSVSNSAADCAGDSGIRMGKAAAPQRTVIGTGMASSTIRTVMNLTGPDKGGGQGITGIRTGSYRSVVAAITTSGHPNPTTGMDKTGCTGMSRGPVIGMTADTFDN